MRHADAEKIWSHHCIGPEAYDKTMSKRYWSGSLRDGGQSQRQGTPTARRDRCRG